MNSINKNKKRLKAVVNTLYSGTLATMSGLSLNRAKLLLRYVWKKMIQKEEITQVIKIGVTFRCLCICVHCSSGLPKIKQDLKDKEIAFALSNILGSDYLPTRPIMEWLYIDRLDYKGLFSCYLVADKNAGL